MIAAVNVNYAYNSALPTVHIVAVFNDPDDALFCSHAPGMFRLLNEIHSKLAEDDPVKWEGLCLKIDSALNFCRKDTKHHD